MTRAAAGVDPARNAPCNLLSDCDTHASSGLRIMRRDYPNVALSSRHTVELPIDCCPVSHNPRQGSTLSIRYVPGAWNLEVYSFRSLLRKFIGGYPGSHDGVYPAERNMEGMIQLAAQMVADALQVPCRFRCILILDTGTNHHSGEAVPQCQ